MQSETKLELAVEFAMKELEDLGYPKLAEEKLVKYIEAKLASERANPMGVVPSDPEVELVAVNGGDSN